MSEQNETRKEEAQAAYDAAFERWEAARGDLKAKREELDEALREEQRVRVQSQIKATEVTLTPVESEEEVGS